jgi:hypothetical protein
LKTPAAIALGLLLIPCFGHAAALNLSSLTCDKYENEVLPAAATNPTADSINTVMWLFGYAVAKSGAHVMFPDALAPFGFALDNECKSNPAENMLAALSIVKPEAKNPLDISAVECASFAARHAEFARSDTESATTIMMWLYGFSVAVSGSQQFDPDSVHAFESRLLAACDKNPTASLLDTLKTLNVKPKRPPRAKAS